MSDTSSRSGGGVGVAGLLGVLFIGLKLGHVIDWPWLWVLSPFWIPVAFAAVLLLAAGLCIGVAKGVTAALDRRSDKKEAEAYKDRVARLRSRS